MTVRNTGTNSTDLGFSTLRCRTATAATTQTSFPNSSGVLSGQESIQLAPISVSNCESIAISAAVAFEETVGVLVKPAIAGESPTGIAFLGDGVVASDPVNPDSNGVSTVFVDTPFDEAHVSLLRGATSGDPISISSAWWTCIPFEPFS